MAAPLRRDESGHWSWVASRITGLLTLFFLFAHVLDTSMLRVSAEAYDQVAGIYKNPFVGLVEVALVGAVLFHALYGLRVTVIDFWAKGAQYRQQLSWAVGFAWIVVMVPTTFLMLSPAAAQVFGST